MCLPKIYRIVFKHNRKVHLLFHWLRPIVAVAFHLNRYQNFPNVALVLINVSCQPLHSPDRMRHFPLSIDPNSRRTMVRTKQLAYHVRRTDYTLYFDRMDFPNVLTHDPIQHKVLHQLVRDCRHRPSYACNDFPPANPTMDQSDRLDSKTVVLCSTTSIRQNCYWHADLPEYCLLFV